MIYIFGHKKHSGLSPFTLYFFYYNNDNNIFWEFYSKLFILSTLSRGNTCISTQVFVGSHRGLGPSKVLPLETHLWQKANRHRAARTHASANNKPKVVSTCYPPCVWFVIALISTLLSVLSVCFTFNLCLLLRSFDQPAYKHLTHTRCKPLVRRPLSVLPGGVEPRQSVLPHLPPVYHALLPSPSCLGIVTASINPAASGTSQPHDPFQVLPFRR